MLYESKYRNRNIRIRFKTTPELLQLTWKMKIDKENDYQIAIVTACNLGAKIGREILYYTAND